MTCICKQCGRDYRYDNEVGYDRELCGPLCDGLFHGKSQNTALKAQLREAVRLLKAAHHIVYTKGETEDDTGLLIDMDCFFDQNADIVTELSQDS